MKIAYILYHDITINSGVTKKIKDQVDQWRRNGHEVQTYAFLPRKGASILEAKQYIVSSPIKDRIFINYDILNDLEIFKPDIIYYRYDIWTNTLSKILTRYYSVYEAYQNFAFPSLVNIGYVAVFLAGTIAVIIYKGNYFHLAYVRLGIVILSIIVLSYHIFNVFTFVFNITLCKRFIDSVKYHSYIFL